MKLTGIVLSKATLALAMLLFATGLWADPVDDATAVVAGFNRSITDGDAAAAVAHLASGGVQFTLRPLHDGVDPDRLATPLVDHWSMILPVIFNSTEDYARRIEVLSAASFGDIATVWVDTTTVSQRIGQSKSKTNEFTETYMLIASSGGWKIASIADNRQATKLLSQ